MIEVDGRELGLVACTVVLKLEHLQHTGSFKARGAFANLLLRDVPDAGVAAASGGNHGAAVAYAARRLGVRARVFVPGYSSPAKVDRIRGYGAELVVGGDDIGDSFAACTAWAAESGALEVHPYDQRETMLGTGTIAAELEEQVGSDRPACWSQSAAADCSAASRRGSPVASTSSASSRSTRRRCTTPSQPANRWSPRSAAWPLTRSAPRRLGELVYPIVARWANQPVLVDDAAIAEVAASAVGSPADRRRAGRGDRVRRRSSPARSRREPGERIAVVLSGANTASIPSSPAAAQERPHVMSGKFVKFVQTGNLVFVSGHIANRDGEPWRWTARGRRRHRTGPGGGGRRRPRPHRHVAGGDRRPRPGRPHREAPRPRQQRRRTSRSSTSSPTVRRRCSSSASAIAVRMPGARSVSPRCHSASASRSSSSPNWPGRPNRHDRRTPPRLWQAGRTMSYRGSATDQDALNLFLFRLYSNLQGAVTAALVHLGDRLGLFRALADADEPLSSADLAAPNRPRRAVGARVGVPAGRRRADRRRPGERADLAHAGGRRRARRRDARGVRARRVRPPARLLLRVRRRRARASGRASGTTTTTPASSRRSGSSGRSSRGTATTSSPTCCRRSTA